MLLLFLCLIRFRSTLKAAQNQKTLDILVQEVRAIHSDFSLSAVTGNCKFKPEQWTILQLLVSSIVMVGHQFFCPFRCSQEILQDMQGRGVQAKEGGCCAEEGRQTEGGMHFKGKKSCVHACVYI